MKLVEIHAECDRLDLILKNRRTMRGSVGKLRTALYCVKCAARSRGGVRRNNLHQALNYVAGYQASVIEGK